MVDEEKPEKSEEEWSDLQSEVDDAIKKRDASRIDFSSKTIYQCKFQQKYTEIEKSEFSALFSVIIFGFGLGTGTILGLRSDDVASISKLIFGLVLMFGSWFILYRMIYTPMHDTCKEIIINTEKQIQKLSKEEHFEDKFKPKC